MLPPFMEGGGVVRWFDDVQFNSCDGTAELDHAEGKMDNRYRPQRQLKHLD